MTENPQTSIEELEKEVERRFSIYNYTLRNSYKAQDDKISYLINSLSIIEERTKKIEEYIKKPWYKKIFNNLKHKKNE